MTARVTSEAIAAAYAETGNVWVAGQRLGISGQTVHTRLAQMGVNTSNRWTNDELDRLRLKVADGFSIPEIALELGRPYSGVACKMSQLGLKVERHVKSKRRDWKGRLTAEVCSNHLRALIRDRLPVTRYAQQVGIPLGPLMAAFVRHVPDLLDEYRAIVSTLPPITCSGCTTVFTPLNTKQVYCSAICGTRHQIDQTYFGGKRAETVGLSDGVCSLCREEIDVGLSAHHVYGKEHDPDNEHLVALCRGCHKAVTFLASRDWVTVEGMWEHLVHLCVARSYGDQWGGAPEEERPTGIYVNVEIRPKFTEAGWAALPKAWDLFPEQYADESGVA